VDAIVSSDTLVSAVVDRLDARSRTTPKVVVPPPQETPLPSMAGPAPQEKRKNERTSPSNSSDSDSETSQDEPRYTSRLPEIETNPAQKKLSAHGVKVLRPVNHLFRKALDYRNYRLNDTSTLFDDSVSKVVSKKAKRLEVQMKPLVFDGKDPISIINFLVHLEPYGAQVSSKSITTYPQAVNYLLRTYASDDVIKTSDAEIRNFAQGTRSETEFAHALYDRALRCGPVYKEMTLMNIFVDALSPSIEKNVRLRAQSQLCPSPKDRHRPPRRKVQGTARFVFRTIIQLQHAPLCPRRLGAHWRK